MILSISGKLITVQHQSESATRVLTCVWVPKTCDENASSVRGPVVKSLQAMMQTRALMCTIIQQPKDTIQPGRYEMVGTARFGAGSTCQWH